MDSILIKNQDAWVLLLDCIRYSMGRRSYMTGLAPELVLEYRDCLDKGQLEQMKIEVEVELDREERVPGHLGSAPDVASWKAFVQELNTILENWEEEEKERRMRNTGAG